MLALLAGQAAGQVDRTWAQALDGNFGDGANWSPAGSPQAVDSVFINAEGDPYSVFLDDNYVVRDFSLTWSGATLEVQSNGIGTSRDFTLTSGTVRGFNEGGAVLIGRDAALTSGVMRDFSQLSAVRHVVAQDMLFENIDNIDIGATGSLTIRGDTVFSGVGMVNASGDIIIDTGGGAFASFDDTCVSNGRNTTWTGAGMIGLSNGAEIMNPGGSGFQSMGDGDQTLMGDGETTTFDNGGMFTKGGPEGRVGRGLPSRTEIVGVLFNNTGTVQVEYGELDFNTQIVNEDNQLDKGTWKVMNSSTLTLREQSIEALTNGAKVLVSGELATFNALDSLKTIGSDSELAIEQGKNFAAQGVFSNVGKLFIGEGSEFDAQEGGLANLGNGIMLGGDFEVEGILALPKGDEVLLLDSKVALVGEGSTFDALDSVAVVGSVGEFAVRGGRQFATAGNFFVIQGGKVRVGESSLLEVTGQLNNFDDGVFDAAFFEVAGTLKAPGLAINEISNELILDGVGSQFLNSNNEDALASLTYIAPDGILRLRNGRSLQNLDSLIVDGILEIDPGPGGTRGPDYQLTTVGDIEFTSDSELIIGVDGAGIGQFGSLMAGADVELGEESAVGGLLTIDVSDAYQAKLGDELVFIRGASVLGTFGATQGLDLGNGLFFQVIYGPDTVSLLVVPSPASGGLLALAGLTAMRRRRR